MKNLDKAQATPSTARKPAAAPAATPPDPPEDQQFFNESLEFGLRSIGRLMERRRPDVQPVAPGSTAGSPERGA